MYPWQLHRSKRYIYLLHGFVSVWDDAGKGNDVVLEVQTPNQESIMQKKSACAFAFKIRARLIILLSCCPSVMIA